MKSQPPISRRLCFQTVTKLLLASSCCHAAIHVSPSGNDSAAGNAAHPVATPGRALELSIAKNDPVMLFADGTYFLTQALVLGPKHSGTAERPRILKAKNEGMVVFSAGKQIQLTWKPGAHGIYRARVPADAGSLRGSDGMYVAGQQPRLARFPNYDSSARWLKGSSKEAFSPERIRTWKNPAGGMLHSMHPAHWGGNHWMITGKKSASECTLEGGWMNNRGGGVHPTDRFVENIREELDAPGEWFLDHDSRTLYFKPSGSFKSGKGRVILSRNESCVRILGSSENPVRHLAIDGISFRHTTRTVMKTREPLLRSDWRIYRGGAVYLEGAENVSITNCEFTDLGGNAYFASGYNRDLTVEGCHFHRIGASAICFVGLTSAVHNPMYDPYGKPVPFDQINKKGKGPRTDDYPARCAASDCLIHDIGLVEKQVAGLQISVAHRVTGRHLSIYDVPRAGINIGENAFGGHLIEHCDVFDTVQESADHGSFNSWGRDRYWHTNYPLVEQQVAGHPQLPRLDMLDRNVIRNSRWRCDHGWDIDLDDGSSWYLVENNLCLGGGIKLREGYHRTVRNNLVVANTFHPHVWFKHSGDRVYSNIWATPYKPIQNRGRGERWDNNIHLSVKGLKQARAYGVDAHGMATTLNYRNPDQLDYLFPPNAAVEQAGFKPFDLTRFGVQKPSLKKIARVPEPATLPKPDQPESPVLTVAGATIKNVETLGEVSATGLPDQSGVLFTQVKPGGFFARSGLKNNDVIRSVSGGVVGNCTDFLYAWARADTGRPVSIGLWRSQKLQTRKLPPFPGKVLLAGDAKIHGNAAFYDPDKQYIGRWTGQKTSLSWRTTLRPGTAYTVVIDQAHPQQSNNTYRITGMKEPRQLKVQPTKTWETFRLVSPPVVFKSLGRAEHKISLAPESISRQKGAALMNFRAFILIEK